MSSGQAEVLVLMNIALCLMVFYKMGCINCAIHQWWIREPKLNKKKHMSDFLHSFSVGVVDDWMACLMWEPYFNYLLHWEMYHRISWRITRHNSAWSPWPPKTDLSAALCCRPEDCGASAATGRQQTSNWPPPPEWAHTGDCGTGWSGLQLWGLMLQKLGATFTSTFTCLGGTF